MHTCKRHMMKHSKLLIVAITFSLLSVMLIGCTPTPAPYVPDEGSPLAPTTGEPEPPATPPHIEVFIDGLAFNPAVLNVPAGTIVVWYNNDSVTHTVTARDNLFDSGNLSPGDTFRYDFDQSGALEYYCRIHPSMVGIITVE